MTPISPTDHPSLYRIRIKGQLGPDWADWFDHFELSTDGQDTILAGRVSDQAALHGLLGRVLDLGLLLLSVERVEPDAL